MGNNKGPALYELISRQPVAPNSNQQQDVHDQEEDLDHNVLTPGRSVRMSVGTVGVCLAICIALIVIAYTMGFRRGHAIASEDYGNTLYEEIESTSFHKQDEFPFLTLLRSDSLKTKEPTSLVTPATLQKRV